MNGAGYEFLAGPSLSRDEDSGVAPRDPGDLFAQLTNCRARSHDLRGTLKADDRLAEPSVFAQEPGVLHGADCRRQQDFRHKGFGDEVERAASHALDRELD